MSDYDEQRKEELAINPEFVKASPSPGHEMYSVHLDTDTLRKRYMEVAE